MSLCNSNTDAPLVRFKTHMNKKDMKNATLAIRYDCGEERKIADQWGIEHYFLPLLYFNDHGRLNIQGIVLRRIVGPFRTVPNFFCMQLIRCGWIEIEDMPSLIASSLRMGTDGQEGETFYIF